MWYFVFIFFTWFLTKQQFPQSRIYLFRCFAGLDGKCPPHRTLWCAAINIKWILFWIWNNSFPHWNKVSRKIVSFSFMVGDCTFPPLIDATKFSTQLAINDHLKRTLHKANWVFMSLSKRHILRFVPRVSFEHLGSFESLYWDPLNLN